MVTLASNLSRWIMTQAHTKNDKLGEIGNGINYDHPDPSSQNISDNCFDVKFISQHIDDSECLLFNDIISETEIENILEHIHYGNVGVEFISHNNDSSAQKNDKLGEKGNGINYNHPDPPSQNIADNCVDVKFIPQHINDCNVSVEFISLYNDSTRRGNNKMVQKEKGRKYNHPDTPS